MTGPAYDHVIVPFDGTAEAQHAALIGSGLAQLMGAELVLATVDELARERERVVAKARAESLSDGAATMWLEPGRSAVAGLATMVSFRPNAVVCMATHARTGLLRQVYGSLGEQLLRAVDAPLLLLGPNCRAVEIAKLHHVVLAMDRSEESVAAIDLATRWATLLCAGTTVVYARDEEEIVVDLTVRIRDLVDASRAVTKVVVPRPQLEAGLLDIVRPEAGARAGARAGAVIVVAATHRTRRDQHQRESFIAKLCRDSPVPVLVQRAGH